jgi:hypothetical protein
MAQEPVFKSVGDTLGPWTVISFEEPAEYININQTAGNIWQIGTPGKVIFNQAFTIPRAIVTDTMGFYPVNNLSSFDLYIGMFNSYLYPYDIFIDFRHKYNTDTLQDGGYITVSWDHGQTWSNILRDSSTAQYFFATPFRNWGMWGNTNLYDTTSTLSNGEPGFSGNSNGWVHTCMAWYDLPVEKSVNFPLDTMILRFNFVSDNDNTNKEGWMIDQIRLYSIDLGSSIHEQKTAPLFSTVTPNPFSATAMVQLSRESDIVSFAVFDVTGRLMSSGVPGKCKSFQISGNNLQKGIYTLRVTTRDGSNSSCKFVVK